ncbi:MAG: hypothetical protein H7Z74_12575 [Anaerolineae bacterium]|nr:hypothetical protein [Gemmatimonadaceae bacterium]
MRLKTFGGLWIESEQAVVMSAVRPRRLGLLAILAAAGQRGLSRDQVLAILWPESDLDRGRHALSQTLYSLRQDLGMEAVLAGSELRLDPTRISTDVEEFRAAVASEDWQHAAALYSGPFLDGFYLSDAAEFERWTEKERSHLARSGLRAIEKIATEATREGRPDIAAESWRRLTRLDPLSSRFAVKYMEALSSLGERASAMAHGQEHAVLVRQELETDPDQEVVRLLMRLREGGVAVPDAIAPAPPRLPLPATSSQETFTNPSVSIPPAAHSAISEAAPKPVSLDQPIKPARLSSRLRWLAAAGAFAGAVVIGAIAWRKSAPAAERVPVLAVGKIQDLVTPDSVQLGGVLSEMLATSLGRLTDLPVIANSRILELIPGGADTARVVRTDAARRAGATQVLEGELIPLPDRRLLFELRRVDIERGTVRRGYQLSGSDRMALFDSMTALIAADLRVAPPSVSLAQVSTRSPIAYRLYEEGLRAYYQFDAYAANRLFNAAIREDSTFAMATYYAWRSEVAINSTKQDALADRALALASRASERDRLLITTHIGAGRSDIRTVTAAAETLATKFPNDPEALMRAAGVTGDIARASALLNRSIALDSAAGTHPNAVCRMCDAFGNLAYIYDWADSVAAVEETMRRWIRLRPADHAPSAFLAEYLVGIGRRGDAEIARRRADSLGAPKGDARLQRLLWSLRSDDLQTADEICRAGLAEDFHDYRWLCAISLRMQGRYRDAHTQVHEGRAPGSQVVHGGLPKDRVNMAILDMEMGRPAAAADLFLLLAKEVQSQPALPPGVATRNATWNLTLSATAAAAANDTARVRALIDSVEAIGARSLFGRDRLLHHFLRGLLLAKAQQHEAAIRAFRMAIHSPSQGYTRINYELGKSLLAVNRPAEAIGILHSALRGGIEGSGLYLTRTETHELLARAFDAAGQRDSAAVHYAIVERAWRGADPVFSARRNAARRWLVAAGRSVR